MAQSGTQVITPEVTEDLTYTGLTKKTPPDFRFIALASIPDTINPLRAGIREAFLKRAKRQQRTGWILLGTGVALITTGIIVAYNHDDNAIVAGVSLVLISGPGVITSLVSIPFFTAASRNRRKAAQVSSSFQLIQSPALTQAGLINRVMPGVGVRMEF
jgi:hypothetical protein